MNELAKKIDKAICKIDESLNIEKLAIAVAQIVKEKYGSHNIQSFEDALLDELWTEEINGDNDQ